MEIKNVHCEKQALELFRMMPDNKKASLHNALSRNLEFTTSWGLELGELRLSERCLHHSPRYALQFFRVCRVGERKACFQAQAP
mgnify:CR=1 FL=1